MAEPGTGGDHRASVPQVLSQQGGKLGVDTGLVRYHQQRIAAQVLGWLDDVELDPVLKQQLGGAHHTLRPGDRRLWGKTGDRDPPRVGQHRSGRHDGRFHHGGGTVEIGATAFEPTVRPLDGPVHRRIQAPRGWRLVPDAHLGALRDDGGHLHLELVRLLQATEVSPRANEPPGPDR